MGGCASKPKDLADNEPELPPSENSVLVETSDEVKENNVEEKKDDLKVESEEPSAQASDENKVEKVSEEVALVKEDEEEEKDVKSEITLLDEKTQEN